MCAKALSGGQNFCGNCGDRLATPTVEILSGEIAALKEEVAKLTEASKGSEQKYLELETAELVVSRVMGWSTRFLYFGGIPAAVILLGLSVWLGRTVNSAKDVVDAGRDQAAKVLNQAKQEAKDANDQASSALATSKQVNTEINATRNNLTSLASRVQDASGQVGSLTKSVAEQQSRVQAVRASTDEQTKAVNILTQQVQHLSNTKIEQQINNLHPEYGAHYVISQGGERLSKDKKNAGQTYVVIDLYNENAADPKISQSAFTAGIQALQSNGFHPMLGQLSLAAGSGSTTVMFGGFNTSMCVVLHLSGSPSSQGAPCIVYFDENLRSRALEAQRLLLPTEGIPDDSIKFIPVASLPPLMKEIVERSGVDMGIILGP